MLNERLLAGIQITEHSYDPQDHIKRIGLVPSPHVAFQVGNYIKAQRMVHALRPESAQRSDIERVLAFLEFIYLGFYASRDERPVQLTSREVLDAITIKERLMEGRPFFCNCSDGRCLTKLMWGFHGQTLRYPAGESKEFRWDSKRKRIYLPNESQLAKELHKTAADLVAHSLKVLIEVFDSHRHCVARKSEEEDRYCKPLEDYGFYYDLLKKVELSEALKLFFYEHYGEHIQLSALHTSFDPETGRAYMGLENHLSEEWIAKNGITDGVLRQLIADDSVLSTSELLGDQIVLKALQKNEFELDYEYNYSASTWRFWQGISCMMDTTHAHITRRVRKLYPHSSEIDVQRRSVLLLANTYTSYLLSLRFGDVYPYAEHTESIIAKSVTEKGPYRIAHAASLDPTNPYPSTALKFFADLIRSNRKRGHMSDPEKDMVTQLFESFSAFVDAPVPMVAFRRVPSMDLPALQALQETDWSDLVCEPWLKWNMDDVERYLLQKISGKIHYISSFTLRAVWELCEKAQELYRYGLPSTEALLEGRIVNAPTLAGPQRETIAIFPFISAEAS